MGYLRNAGLIIRPSMCHLIRKSTKYFGSVVVEHGIEKKLLKQDMPLKGLQIPME